MIALRLFLAVALLCSFAPATLAAPKVAVSFDADGLASLTCDGTSFLKSGLLRVGEVSFAGAKGEDVKVERSAPTASFEREAQRVSQAWPWGAVRCRYQLDGARLNLELTIENDTAGALSGIELTLLELQFPRRPGGTPWERRFQMLGDNDGDITALVADYRTGVLTFCNDDPGTRLRSGFSPGAMPPQETWSVIVTSPDSYGEPLVFVQPRSRKTFRFSLRFSDPGVPLKTIARDLQEKFAAAHPFQLKWPDRRPIGMLVLSSPAHTSPTNPRGWLSEPQLDFTGKNGAKRFRQKMFEAADRSIAILQDMGAQGMIFWDPEGEEFPNINYVGDPRMMAKLAPEMDALAPELFARFIKAGLRTGVCLRPSRIVPGWDGKSKWQHSHMGFDVVEEMSQKIAYAKKRLGCLLFYIDSNVRYFNKPDGSVDSRLLEADAFRRLARAHPDVLLIPEIPRLDYWSCTAPYQELRPGMFGGHAATNARALDFYPRAFSVINPVDGPAAERRGDLIAGQRRGDMLLFRCWFGDEQNKLFKAVLEEAKSRQ